MLHVNVLILITSKFSLSLILAFCLILTVEIEISLNFIEYQCINVVILYGKEIQIILKMYIHPERRE